MKMNKELAEMTFSERFAYEYNADQMKKETKSGIVTALLSMITGFLAIIVLGFIVFANMALEILNIWMPG
jgi:hypothetical protein